MKRLVPVILIATALSLSGCIGIQPGEEQELVATLVVHTSPGTLTAILDASGSTGDRFDWVFGDGESLPNGPSVVAHKYPDYGTYVACVTVSKLGGPPSHPSIIDQRTAYATVTLVERPTEFAWEWSISGRDGKDAREFSGGDPIRFYAWADDPEGFPLYKWEIRGLDCDYYLQKDENTFQVFLPFPPSEGCPPECQPPYRYKVRLTIVLSDGRSKTVTTEIKVFHPGCLP